MELRLKWENNEKNITVSEGITLAELVANYLPGYEKDYVGAFVDGRLCELGKKVKSDSEVVLLPLSSPIGYDMYKRSIILLMLKAAK